MVAKQYKQWNLYSVIVCLLIFSFFYKVTGVYNREMGPNEGGGDKHVIIDNKLHG